MKIESKSPSETIKTGEKLGNLLRGGETICLFGEVGAGKTCLAQGIIRGVGIPDNEYPRSPTFSIVNRYYGRFIIHHLDLYRLNTQEDIFNTGIEELVMLGETLVIEWAEKLAHMTLSNKIEITIKTSDENQRIICFDTDDKELQKVLLRLPQLVKKLQKNRKP